MCENNEVPSCHMDENLPSGCAVRFTNIDNFMNAITRNLGELSRDTRQVKSLLCGNGTEGLGEHVRNLDREQAHQGEKIKYLQNKVSTQVWSWWQKFFVVLVSLVAVAGLILNIVRK